jgi:hypothetical protein
MERSSQTVMPGGIRKQKPTGEIRKRREEQDEKETWRKQRIFVFAERSEGLLRGRNFRVVMAGSTRHWGGSGEKQRRQNELLAIRASGPNLDDNVVLAPIGKIRPSLRESTFQIGILEEPGDRTQQYIRKHEEEKKGPA